MILFATSTAFAVTKYSKVCFISGTKSVYLGWSIYTKAPDQIEVWDTSGKSLGIIESAPKTQIKPVNFKTDAQGCLVISVTSGISSSWYTLGNLYYGHSPEMTAVNTNYLTWENEDGTKVKTTAYSPEASALYDTYNDLPSAVSASTYPDQLDPSVNPEPSNRS